MNSNTISSLLLALAFSSACAGAIPPPELVSARASYLRASQGPAATLNPTDLHTAQVSLSSAERSFRDDGNSPETRDLSYAARLGAETAESRARTMQAVADTGKIVEDQHAATEAQAKAATLGLAQANQEIASKNQALAAQGVALQSEVQLRQAADKRAAQATADLAKFASVKQESRGMVITLSGGVLFTSGETTLLPAAQLKLNDVAKALTEQDPESKMVVEGHTDSQGSAVFNQDLSQRRAQAVRDYLVSRGIAGDRISAEGLGLTRAVGDNNTPDGRANNRRVEIIVKPKS